jgi:hypothetical protein
MGIIFITKRHRGPGPKEMAAGSEVVETEVVETEAVAEEAMEAEAEVEVEKGEPSRVRQR